jgi:hypothetical protein
VPKVVIIHNVTDVERWLSFKSERVAAIGQLGGTDVMDHVARDGSNSVAITADLADVDTAMATVASPPPELGAVMEKHGVVPPLVVYVEK